MLNTIMNNLHLEKIVYIIKKSLLVMILAGLICGAAGGAYAMYSGTSTYLASVSFYAYTNADYITDGSVSQSASEVSAAKYLVQSYTAILTSGTFLKELLVYLGYEPSSKNVAYLQRRIGVTSSNTSALFKVSVADEDPEFAAKAANAIGVLAPDKVIAVVKSGGIFLLDEAVVPEEPTASTSVVKYIIFGFAAGFGFVAVIALLKGLLNTVIRRQYEVEQMVNIPIIGVVPDMSPRKKKEKVDFMLSEKSPFAIKEAYSGIRSNLHFTAKGEKCPVYAICSADPNEGKSTNLINIARSYVMMGKKVLLIDGDMRKGTLYKSFNIKKPEDGLSDYLADPELDVPYTNITDNFDVIFSGSIPPNPAELMYSDRFKQLISSNKEQYDVIFIDMPPIVVVNDALVVSDIVTAYILVVREMSTRMERLEQAVRKFEALDADICGIIYNGINNSSPDYSYGKRYYGKNYGYYGESDSKTSSKGKHKES